MGINKTQKSTGVFSLKRVPVPDFADTHSADVVPDLANEFCTTFLPQLISHKDPHQGLSGKSCSLFGKTKEQALTTIYFIKLLCNWLCAFGYSEGNVELDKSSLGHTMMDPARVPGMGAAAGDSEEG